MRTRGRVRRAVGVRGLTWLSAVAACLVVAAAGAPAADAAAGTISTIAGNGAEGPSSDGEPATSAEIVSPEGVAVDPAGDPLIAVADSHEVGLVAASSCSSDCPYGLSSMTQGDFYVVAGNETQGFASDGEPAISAEIGNPHAVATGSSGDLLIADTFDNTVWLVAASSCSSDCPYGLSPVTEGDIYAVAGTGASGDSGDNGPATSAELQQPAGVTVDSGGDLLIANTGSSTVRLVAASSCSSDCPYGLSSMTEGDIYPIAGNDTNGYSGDGVPATSAQLDHPQGVAVDSDGNVLIADTSNAAVRLVAASSCSSDCPYGLPSMTEGDIYPIAGNGTLGSPVDGEPAASAELGGVQAVAFDPGGDLLIADTDDDTVQLVAASSCSSDCPYGLSSMTEGDIYTIAGNGIQGFSGDGGPATSAELFHPAGVAVESGGNLLIADSVNNRVRLVTYTAASPSLPVDAPSSGTAGRPIAASAVSATLSGGSAPTGTITFTVFGPQATAPPSCAFGGTTVGTANVSGNGTYHPSAGFTPSAAGDYWWYASYGGDVPNNPSASACGATMAETVVKAAATTTALSASPASAVTGQAVTLTAVVSPVPSGGTVHFLTGGTTITGCATAAVNTTTGEATCRTAFITTGRDRVEAAFSGNSAYSASTSAAVAETVRSSLRVTGTPSGKDGHVKLTLSCAAGAAGSGGCRTAGKLTLVEVLRGKKVLSVHSAPLKHKPDGDKERTVTIATKTTTLTAGKTTTVTLTLNASGRKLLTKFRRLPARLTVTLTVGGHTSTVETRNVTVKAR